MLKKLKEKVKHCLSNYPDTRNSDIKLTNAVWYYFYRDKLKLKDGVLSVNLVDLYDLPSNDSIRRIRAIFNARGEFLPNDPTVRRQRQIKEEEWRKFLSYNPEMRTV